MEFERYIAVKSDRTDVALAKFLNDYEKCDTLKVLFLRQK